MYSSTSQEVNKLLILVEEVDGNINDELNIENFQKNHYYNELY